MAVKVEFSDLDDWLKSQPKNTKDTPYQLNITELTEKNIDSRYVNNTLGFILHKNQDKFVDLRETSLPYKDYIKDVFSECSNLIYPPKINDLTKHMVQTFYGCINLKEPCELPISLKILNDVFSYTSIEKTPDIPPNVENIQWAFRGCNNLKICTPIPYNVSGCYETFYECTSLSEVTLDIDPRNISEDKRTNCFYGVPDTCKIYVREEFLDYFKDTHTQWSVNSPDMFIPVAYNDLVSFISKLNNILYITANPSEYEVTISEDGKTANIWNSTLEGSFSNKIKFPESLISADLSGINFRSVKNYSYMFFYCTSLRKIVFPKMTMSNCELIRAFAGCSSLSQIDMTQVEIRTPINTAEMFSLDKITVFYNPKKWDIKPHTRFGNATKAKFVPIEEIENKVEVNSKQIGTFYHNNQRYDKMIKGNNAYYLDNYKYLFGENNGEIDTNSAWGEMAEDGFEAWIF